MLKGINVVEFQGLAPSVFCGHYFADQGANVIIVARKQPPPVSMAIHKNLMNKYKQCICLSMKDKNQRKILQQLLKDAQVVIDPYRPGVLEKLGYGPDDLFKINKGIILLRVSGYGQSGPLSMKPGHDLNYISVSGIVPQINQNRQQTQFPTNFLADFVSASLGITATLVALDQSRKTGIGGVVDSSLCWGCKYFSKVISENPSHSSQPIIKYIKIDEKEYCISSERQEEIRELLKNPKIILQKLGNSKYLKNKNVEMSEVCQLDSFEQELKNPRNAFDPKGFPSELRKIIERGESTEEIIKLIKPKL